MVGKRGFLRVIEATIAVLIILGALFVISSQREIKSRPDLTDILRSLLDEVAKNQELREKIVDYNLTKLRNDTGNKETLANISEFLDERIKNPIFNYSISICAANVTCPLQISYPVDSPEDIYATERIITTTLSSENPDYRIRKKKLFLWRKI